MASNPGYLVPSAQAAEDIDLDIIDPAIIGMSHSSCSTIPSTLSYSTRDHNSYSEISHISAYTTPILDDRLLTPTSSAASPQLRCKHSASPFEHHSHQQHHPEDSAYAQQQPTPPHTTSMYPFPEYMNPAGQQGPSSMSMTSTLAEATAPLQQHNGLLPYLQQPSHHHNSPPGGSCHDDANVNHLPPQSNPYFGSYTVSVPPEQNHFYMPNHAGDIGPMGLLHQDLTNAGGAYTHRPLTPTHHHQQQHHPAPSQYRLRRLSPTAAPPLGRHHVVPRGRRDRSRKKSARQSIQWRDSFSPPEVMHGDETTVGGAHHHHHHHHSHDHHQQQHIEMVVDDGPNEEVTLDDKTPADLRRLWETRRKWLGKKGNGMWENIMTEYYGGDNLTANKKTQVKASLQMKIHRMLLKHGKWPERDESALLRAYKRWEESRYTEIYRLYDEEMAGRKKGYDWKSQHIEAQLVKMGLEEPERDRDSRARKRKQVAARHQARASASAASAAITMVALRPQQQQQQQQQHRNLSGMFDPVPPFGQHHYIPALHGQQQHYEHQQNRTPSYDGTAFDEIICVQPPALSDEQNDRLAREILKHNPFAECRNDVDDDDNDDDDDDDDDNDESEDHNGRENPDHDDADIKMEMLSRYNTTSEHRAATAARSRAASLIPRLQQLQQPVDTATATALGSSGSLVAARCQRAGPRRGR